MQNIVLLNEFRKEVVCLAAAMGEQEIEQLAASVIPRVTSLVRKQQIQLQQQQQQQQQAAAAAQAAVMGTPKATPRRQQIAEGGQ